MIHFTLIDDNIIIYEGEYDNFLFPITTILQQLPSLNICLCFTYLDKMNTICNIPYLSSYKREALVIPQKNFEIFINYPDKLKIIFDVLAVYSQNQGIPIAQQPIANQFEQNSPYTNLYDVITYCIEQFEINKPTNTTIIDLQDSLNTALNSIRFLQNDYMTLQTQMEKILENQLEIKTIDAQINNI